MSTHPVALIPNPQCVKCGNLITFQPQSLKPGITHVNARCRLCQITVRVPITIIHCVVVPEPHETTQIAEHETHPCTNGVGQ